MKVVPRFPNRSLAVWLSGLVDHICRDIEEDVAVPQLQRIRAAPLEDHFACSDIDFLEAAILDIAFHVAIVRRQVDLFQVIDAVQECLA